ncbi:MAG: class I SAM-dependent methyltransferase [Muribaculaceae bacterium]|nr:class I SAM-dependent methyltransferase [Muribaculaceae bacterium]
MNKRKDPMGQAIADYNCTGRAARLQVFSPMFDNDVMPLEVLFRGYEDMPALERTALDMAKGRVLDVGAGAGCHSLILQERGMDVTAIDISPLSVETMKARGVKQVIEQDFFTLTGQYDTVLMLMNGIGIVGRLKRMPEFFACLDHILSPGGQVLCDSSDISYLYEDTNGLIQLPDDVTYYGEHAFTMKYKDIKGDPFPWLYVDATTLRKAAQNCGYNVEVVAEGNHYDYLARITRL